MSGIESSESATALPVSAMTPECVPPVTSTASDARAAATSPLAKASPTRGCRESDSAPPVTSITADGRTANAGKHANDVSVRSLPLRLRGDGQGIKIRRAWC
eukprot:859943-Pleurochrysis_carterae.AAC.2